MKKKELGIYIVLVCLPIIIVALLTQGNLFGSNIDWISQHTTLPDYFRKMVWQNHSILFNYFPHLQGGSNAYNFSYYGFFRPDILISIFLPNVDMATIIIIYMMFLMSLGSIACYYWLQEKGYNHSVSLFTTIVYLTTTCLIFQSHRQIMFVNYLPFLFLALHAIDKEKWRMLTVCLFLIVIHSYFYAIAAYMICFITIGMEKKKFVFKPFIVSLCLAGILLIPTFLVILENKHSQVNNSLLTLVTPNLQLSGLLYHPYGCGFGILSWISIVLGLQSYKMRNYSIALIIGFVLPLVAYVLNGTLYARGKILIVFIPWVIWLVADCVSNIKDKNLNILWIAFMTIPAILQVKYLDTALIDICIVILALLVSKNHPKAILFSLVVPIYMMMSLNVDHTFVDPEYFEDVESVGVSTNNESGRTAYFIKNLQSSNQVQDMSTYRISSYTSTGNSKYNRYLYDVMKNPISASNRVANLDNSNIFVQGMMNIRHIVTKDKVPVGYQLVYKENDIKHYENNNVLPLAYTTNQVMNQKTYDKLGYPYNLDTIYNRAIVQNGKSIPYKSKFKKINSQWIKSIHNKDIIIQSIKNKMVVHSKKNNTVVFNEPSLENKQVVLIDFKVKQRDSNKKTKISINGIRNCLSKQTSVYHNGNYRFTYILSSNKLNRTLKVNFSKGAYELSDFRMYTLPYDVLKNHQKDVTAMKQKKTNKNEILKGNVYSKTDGYFVTSLPYQNGYKCFVDGKEVKSEVVNTAFIGFPISKGKHMIDIQFEAPGKKIGLILGIIGLIALIRKKGWYEKD